MMEELLKKLQEARKDKGLSQAELGIKAGLPQSHISQIESGKIDIRLSSFLEIARLLDLEPMLIPRHLTPAVRSMLSGNSEKTSQQPAWQVDETDEERAEELS